MKLVLPEDVVFRHCGTWRRRMPADVNTIPRERNWVLVALLCITSHLPKICREIAIGTPIQEKILHWGSS